MATVLLIAAGVFACWAISVYLHPFRHCGRCSGTGRIQRASAHRRFDPCRRCTGTGRIQRTGSRAAHRTVLSVRAELARERQRRRDRKTAARIHPPHHNSW